MEMSGVLDLATSKGYGHFWAIGIGGELMAGVWSF
jgi:hypothetical protein